MTVVIFEQTIAEKRQILSVRLESAKSLDFYEKALGLRERRRKNAAGR